MTPLLLMVVFAVAVPLATVALLTGLAWLALWVRTRVLTRRGLTPVTDPDPDTDEIPTVQEGHR